VSYDLEVRPFSRIGKLLLMLNFLVLFTIVLMAVGYYFILPDRVPVHYDASGNPTSYGDKILLVYTSLGFMIAPIVIIVVTLFRFKLINKYPYLISLPAFMMHLRELSRDQRSIMVNMVFEIILAVGFIMGFGMLLMEYVMFESAINPAISQFIGYFVLLFVFMTVISVAIAIYMYKRIYDRLKSVIG
jgi:uncharacterized membrane protein